jgi:trehalose synthase
VPILGEWLLLQKVDTAEKKLDSYKGIVMDNLLKEVETLGRDLRGLQLCHISSTPFGGGVPEVLFSVIPLERDLGIQVDWYTLRGTDQFFRVGKSIHNALQGDCPEIGDRDRALYLQYNNETARGFSADKYDVIIVHTHDLLPLPHYTAAVNRRWVWRCHLDTSSPNQSVWEFLKPFAQEYQGAIFTTEESMPSDLQLPVVKVIPPAIDPLSPKNRDLPWAECIDFVTGIGIDPKRPIVLHSSRLDHWKDPAGLLACYYLAKDSVPELQLIITSSLTLNDPDTFSTLRIVDAEAAKEEDIHVYTNMDGFGDIEINVLQRVCSVGVLKSLREGFGLSVAETLWKGRPVLGSRAGGIPLQLAGKLDYCLVNDVRECARKLVHLLTDEEYARELGEFGHEHIRRNFLSPRLVRDELAFVKSLMGQPTPSPSATKTSKG